MLWLRSALYNIVFYVNLFVFLVGGAFFLVTPRSWAMAALKTWATTSLWWLKVICGTRMEVRGREHIPEDGALVAGKHQSTWETFAILPLFADPAVVLKRELTYIPFFGWFIFKFRMIPVEREAGPSALRAITARAQAAVAMGRQIIMFPEGTRRAPGAPPDYKPGATALYLKLGKPCVPFALNSGLYWPRRKFLRRPGTIILEFLPPIPPGLPRREFERRLIEMVETATARLEAEADLAYKK
ncbi:MAG: lysophospholipid acyltransferase family protein [Hyphomicrobiales bacterium]